jgi:protein TonB
MLETFRHCREKASKARSQPLEPEPEPEPEPGPEPEPEPELPWLDLPEGTPHE